MTSTAKPAYALVKLSDHARRHDPFEIGDRLDEHFDAGMIEKLIARGEATHDEKALHEHVRWLEEQAQLRARERP